MTITARIFRRLVLAYAGVALLSLAAGMGYLGAGFSPLLQAAYDSEPSAAMALPLPLLGVLLVVSIAVLLAGLVGLYRLRRWGRSLSLWSTVLYLPLMPALGPSLETGLESMLMQLTSVLWGGLLALAYCSPVSVAFDRAGRGAQGPELMPAADR